MDLKALGNHYRSLSDDVLRHLATHQAEDLTPEALTVLRQELASRTNLGALDATVEAQRREWTHEEFDGLVERFRREPCPICGEQDTPLNGVEIHSQRDVEDVVGCPSCLERLLHGGNRNSLALAILKPWAGLRATHANDEAIRELAVGAPTDALRRYLWTHRGEWVHLLKNHE